jgi:hypothetical protein
MLASVAAATSDATPYLASAPSSVPPPYSEPKAVGATTQGKKVESSMYTLPSFQKKNVNGTALEHSKEPQPQQLASYRPSFRPAV